MSNDGPTYKSYLLRLSRAGPDAPWRATLTSVTDAAGEPRHFADVESLVAHLLIEFEARGPPTSKPTRPED